MITNHHPLYLGAAYYPEHWPETRWPEDIQLMRSAGLNVVRMGEFAWSTFEPREGEFDFDWLERAIALLAENGIATVLGTPTAAPPAWLTFQYPHTLAVDEDGRRAEHGKRCHYCVNSPEYHLHSRRIVSAMAERFGANPNVIGWQLDNEYNRICYCDTCRGKFRQFLAEKFETLEQLNQRWTTRYWSQTYSAWEQIPLPTAGHNPGLLLEFQRFVTRSYREFQEVQLQALRPHLSENVWVTHNFMGWFDHFDHYEMSADLDLAAWDWYIGSGHHDPLKTGAIHDLTRGFKRKNFWVMETQPGSVNWAPINSVLNRGEGRAMAWHAVGHGAEAILYWQWRSPLGGQEQYHGTLVDPSGQPRPFYTEVQQIGTDFTAAGALFAGTTPTAQVAILNDYASRWSIQWQPHHKDFDYVAHLNHYYHPLATRNISVDIISAEADLHGYKLVIAPALGVLTESRAEALKAFVKRGGALVLTARCAMKDEYNALLPARQPGALADIAGVLVDEYYALDEPVPVKGNWFSGVSNLWAERLKLIGKHTQSIAKYGPGNGWLDDQVGITVNMFGTGMVYYVGTYLDEAAQDALIGHFLETNNIRPLMNLPPGVEICRRSTPDGVQIGILINHTQATQTIHLPWGIYDHLSGQQYQDEVVLEAYAVKVFTRAA